MPTVKLGQVGAQRERLHAIQTAGALTLLASRQALHLTYVGPHRVRRECTLARKVAPKFGDGATVRGQHAVVGSTASA